ncbi:MAG: Uncharacterized amino acid permease, GabP family, partial [uncultured Gemmatimonadetes bacterium]
ADDGIHGAPGQGRSRRRGAAPGSFAAGRGDAGGGLHDRLGHLHRLGRHRPQHGLARRAGRRVGGVGADDAGGGAQLRRAGGGHAPCRRPVRVPARRAGAHARLPVRMDAVHGHPDGDDRGRGGGLQQVPGRLLSRGFARRVRGRQGDPDAGGRHRPGAQQPAAGGHRHHRAAHLGEPAGAARGQVDPDLVHHRQDRRPGRSHPAGRYPGPQRRRRRGQLRQLLAGVPGRHAGVGDGHRRSPDRHGVRQRDGGLALFVGRVEQRDLRSGRGAAAGAQPSAGPGAGHGAGDGAVRAGQLRLPVGAVAERDQVGAAGPGGHPGAGAHVRPRGAVPDGGRHPGEHLRLHQRADPGRGARVLRHGARRAVLCPRGRPEPQRRSRVGAGGAGRVDGAADADRHLRPAARLRDLRGAALLRADDVRAVLAAPEAAGPAAAVQGVRLSPGAGAVRVLGLRRGGHPAGGQARVLVLGADPGSAGHSRLLHLGAPHAVCRDPL